MNPREALDRAALITLLLDYLRGTHVQAEPLADRILALVRPVAGVTLTPEEAALAAARAMLEDLAEKMREGRTGGPRYALGDVEAILAGPLADAPEVVVLPREERP